MAKMNRGRTVLGRESKSSDLSAVSLSAAQHAVIRSALADSSEKSNANGPRAAPAASRMPYIDRPLTFAKPTPTFSRPRTPVRGESSKSELLTDSTPIARTSSLVGLFEQKSSGQMNPNTPEKIDGDRRPRPNITIASPERKLAAHNGNRTSSKESSSPTEFKRETQSFDESISPKSKNNPKDRSAAKVVDITAISTTRRGALPQHGNLLEPPISESIQSAPRNVAPQGHSSTKPIPIKTKSHRSSPPAVDVSLSTSLSSKSITAQYNQMYTQRLTPLSTGDELANAIVASSLASSRGPSPRRLEPPPPSSRRPKTSSLPFSRTPSPAKHTMLHTLRKVDPPDMDESDHERHPYQKHKKKRLVRKHPNKHHEGDRKRWRDAITERERKRYDGVWAANRGLYCALVPSDSDNSVVDTAMPSARGGLFERVSNLVVRDIWSRSRLPDLVLENIWDLVDSDGIGRLTKDEFVVGLWLIDQRLKGRKLPVKVSNSVWTSVRSLQGIKIRS